MSFALTNDGFLVDECDEQRVSNVSRFYFDSYVGRRRVSKLCNVAVMVIIRNLPVSNNGNYGEGFAAYDNDGDLRDDCCFGLFRAQAGRLRYDGVRVYDRVADLLCFCGFFD